MGFLADSRSELCAEAVATRPMATAGVAVTDLMEAMIELYDSFVFHVSPYPRDEFTESDLYE